VRVRLRNEWRGRHFNIQASAFLSQ
jgi:hypothetical protein